jgi:transposase
MPSQEGMSAAKCGWLSVFFIRREAPCNEIPFNCLKAASFSALPSYFGGTKKGKRGRGAAGKVAVFGMLKRKGKVYTIVVQDTSSSTLMNEITRKIKLQSIVYTDNYQSYNALDVSGFHHHRINHSDSFTEKKNHINGIENFWNQAKRVLRKYNGIDKKAFPLFLKECEFRFNHGTPREQLETLRTWCGI